MEDLGAMKKTSEKEQIKTFKKDIGNMQKTLGNIILTSTSPKRASERHWRKRKEEEKPNLKNIRKIRSYSR